MPGTRWLNTRHGLVLTLFLYSMFYIYIYFLNRAVEAGANFLSESFVFGVAAAIIIAEQWR